MEKYFLFKNKIKENICFEEADKIIDYYELTSKITNFMIDYFMSLNDSENYKKLAVFNLETILSNLKIISYCYPKKITEEMFINYHSLKIYKKIIGFVIVIKDDYLFDYKNLHILRINYTDSLTNEFLINVIKSHKNHLKNLIFLDDLTHKKTLNMIYILLKNLKFEKSDK